MAAFGEARVSTVGGVLTPGISPAQAVITESKGLIARDIQLQAGGTAIPGYDARPEAAGRYPIVVVISGFTGSSDQNKDVVRCFAQAGYHAIAPELDAREGGMPGKDFQENEPDLEQGYPGPVPGRHKAPGVTAVVPWYGHVNQTHPLKPAGALRAGS
jgi:dienelactone hydrolase family protein